jgi:hypothetical protein
MPLFRFKPETAEIISCNKHAEEILITHSSHQLDIRRLRSLWIESIEVEIRTRKFLNVVADALASSKIEKFERASTNFRISSDFEKPTFHHEDSECLSQTADECFEQVFQSFGALPAMRQDVGRILEDLVLDVECGVFDARPREIY